MFRSRSRVRHTRPSHGRMRLLAPAALAAVLAGGDARAAAAENATDAEPSDGDVAAIHDRAQLRRLAEHPDRERRISMATFLPEILLEMPPLERMQVVTEWASSRSPYLRLAMARALRHMALHRSTPGAVTAVEHLAGDPDPLVRTAVAEAAWLHRREDPGRLIAVLHRLADDRNRFVREVARLALGDA